MQSLQQPDEASSHDAAPTLTETTQRQRSERELINSLTPSLYGRLPDAQQ
jgi:hypothetical protein